MLIFVLGINYKNQNQIKMKMLSNQFRHFFTHYTLIIVNLFIVSTFIGCESSKDKQDSEEKAEELNEAKFDDNQEDLANFLVEVASINLTESAIGKLAQNKSENAEVKELGKMAESHHLHAQEDLKTLASSKQISLPMSITDDGQKTYDNLNEKSVRDFEKEYVDRTVKSHKDAIDKFEKAKQKFTDADLNNYINTTLSTLRTHLVKAMECQRKQQSM